MGAKKKIRNNIRQKIEERKRLESQKKNETNPFELKRNKIKHNILGRKIAKNEIGKPLLNRSRAIQKRTQTLLEEYKNKHKGGKGFQDFRSDNTEERVISKYKEVQNDLTFQNNEQINLTHKGKPLEDFIDDRLSSDDEDIDLFSRENFVESTHFGGGQDGAPRTANDVLNDLIEEKKQRKFEKEETIMLTEQLDTQWNEIKFLIRHKGSNDTTNQEKREEYDNLLNQLIFEGKTSVKVPNVIPKPVSNVEQNKCTSLTPDVIFKSKLQLIDDSNDINFIIKTLKEILDLLSTVTRKSFYHIKTRLQNLSTLNLKFTPKEICTLIICSYFKELQVLIHLLVFRTLYKLKYSSYHEVAVSLFLNNFLLKTIPDNRLYPEIFIHIDNLVRICLPKEKTKLKLFHRLNYEADCILSIQKFKDVTSLEKKDKLNVSLSSLFDNIFSNTSKSDPNMAYNLSLQVFKLLISLLNKYSGLSYIDKLMASIKKNIEIIKNHVDFEEVINLIDEFETQFSTKQPSIIVNDIRPKPFMLPMLEPKFEEKVSNKAMFDESKKLIKKYRRELKGAQREIRKDSTFMRNTYLKEIDKKDRIRKKKVKELLRDLSVQQGLYKKKS